MRWRRIFISLGATLALLLLAAVVVVAVLLWRVDPASQAAALAPTPPPADGGSFTTVPLPESGPIRLHALEAAAPAVVSGEPTPSAFVLLHGFTFDHSTWRPLLPALTARGRVLAWDQPPYGRSAKLVPGQATVQTAAAAPPPLTDQPGDAPSDLAAPTAEANNSQAGPYTRAAVVAQLLALLDARGIDQAILIGNSAGGTLALEVALAAPQRVRGLVLISPWVQIQRPVFPIWLAKSWPLQRLSLWAARWLGQMPLLEASYADPQRITPARREAALAHRGQRDWDLAWAAALRRSLSEPIGVASRLSEITTPTLVISGAQDTIVPPAQSAAVAAELPRGRYLELPGCGHVAQEECPEQTATAITDWLAAEDRLLYR